MKRMFQIASPIIVVLLITACSSNKDVSQEKDPETGGNIQTQTDHNHGNDKGKQNGAAEDSSEERTKTMTQVEVIQAIKEQMNTNLSTVLPHELPIEEGKHLTAITKASNNSYSVVFYESDEPIPINNEKLVKDEGTANVVARVDVKKYDSQKEADEEIAYEAFSENGGQEVDLGHHITGYQDAGAGSVWTGWNEGRWAFASHAQTSEGDKGIELAKDAVQYLEKNTMPIPKPHGYAHLEVEHKDNRVLWEKKKVVYTIDQIKDPMDALEIATSFH